MKKEYIAPSMDVIEVAPVTVLAASTINVSEDEKDSSVDGVQRGREDHISNPNLWDNAW